MKFEFGTTAFSLVLITSVAFAATDPLNVPITALMKHPKKFNEKRVTFVGYYDTGDGHGTNVRAESSETADRIFLDFTKTKLALKPLQRIRTGTYVRVTGLFRYRELKFTRGKDFNTIVPGFGWMNDYDKEIADITEFIPVAKMRR